MFGPTPSGRFLVFTAAALAVFALAAHPSLAATTLTLDPGSSPGERPAIEVESSNATSVHFVFDLPVLEIDTYQVEGESFQTLSIPGGELHGKVGEPSLPTFTRFVAIPPTSGARVHVLSVEEEVFGDYHLLPMQDTSGDHFAQDRDAYQHDRFEGGEIVSVGAPGVMRDLRVVPLRFSPIKYNPRRGEVRIARRVELELSFIGADSRAPKTRDHVPLTREFDRLYRSLVVNYDSDSDERRESAATHLGTYVVISRDDSEVTSRLQPLLEWRRRMGYQVTYVTTTDIGSTNPSYIRDWLRTAYSEWDDPPEYILMVGDATGTFSLGTFYENFSGFSGEGDHPYSELAGDDIIPDAFIGRLSAGDYTTLERIVNKIIGYESTPYIHDPEWFTRACLTGDPSYSGLTCVQIMQWLKERLLALGYTQVDTIFTSPFRSRTLNHLDDGNTFFGYRGFGGMSTISVGDIASLENGWMLTYAINLTCGTGSWAYGTSYNEAWLRGGTGTTNVTGGIGSIATATNGTHTRYNNCFFAGSTYGMFWNDQHKLGLSQARGKLEMILNYEGYQYGIASTYCYWNTLMGDPATTMWTAYPEELQVDYPATVPIGSRQVVIHVRGGGSHPVEGAWVHLYRSGALSVGGRTDANGYVTLPIDAASSGTVLVTVSGPNLYPHQGSFEIETAEQFVGVFTQIIDDDAEPPSQGNDDDNANPGEILGVRLALKNYGTQRAQDVTVELISDDPYVSIIDSGPFDLGDIAAGSTELTPGYFFFGVDPGSPAGHELDLVYEVRSGSQYTWPSPMPLTVQGPELVGETYALVGVGATLDPGETGELQVVLRNTGSYDAAGRIGASLRTSGYGIQVTDPDGHYSSIAAGETGANSGNRFGILAPVDAIPGRTVRLTVVLETADGIRDTAWVSIPVGERTSTDPTGPDAYGYFAYDQTDTDYPEAPAYDWIDVPAVGSSVGLQDWGWDQDDSRPMDLPFDFQYYGESFDVITICSNGWIAMGNTYLTNYRNWHLPSANGPKNMIAPFWDNLYQSGSGQTYYWYDEDNHRYVVSWDTVRNRNTGSYESFQVILLDPDWYPTPTGDGEIIFQYEIVNDNDSQQMYCTAGIQDETHSSGLTYRYFHQGEPGAANFAAGLAVKFTTGSPEYAGAGSGPGTVPPRLALASSAPNPWRDGTMIRFQLDRPRPVKLQVFDIDGRLVRTLARESFGAGPHTVPWEGCDDSGQPVPSGIYYYRLDAGGQARSQQMIRIR